MASPTTQRGPAFLSRPRGAAVLFAALLVLALGIATAVWSWSPAPPPPAQAPAQATDSRVAAAGEPQATTSEPAPRELPARTEATTPRTAVVGRALDSGGAPLTAFAIALQRTDPRPERRKPLEIQLERRQPIGYPTLFAVVDAAGGFVFESLDAGNYTCHIACQEQTAETFELAAGDVRELTLQSRLVALTGTLRRRGEVVKDCFVEFSGRASPRRPTRDDAGVMRLFAPPGRYEVIVRPDSGAHHGRGRAPCLGRHVLLVPDAPELQWSLETGGTQIVFAVDDPQGSAIDKYTVGLEGVGAFDQEPGRYELHGTRGRPATVPALPAGRWRATVTGDCFRVEPRDFVTGPDDGRVVLSFVAQPAASVRLRLRSSSQFLTAPDARHMPGLVMDGLEVTCKSDAVGLRGGGAPVYEYCAVPPGKATLCFQDRIDGDELVPLPFDPVAPVSIDVAIGSANEVTVDVEPRTFVDLRGCDATGRELSGAMLTVWVDGRRVRNRDAKTSQRWLGWLPRGVHRVVIDRDGAQREHVLRVDRSLVSERYRP